MRCVLVIILAATVISCFPYKKGKKDSTNPEPNKQIGLNDAPRESYFYPCSPKVISKFTSKKEDGWEPVYRCGHVTVPLYHDQPERGSLQLPFIYLPPDKGKDDSKPIVFTQGGPGSSSVELIIRSGEWWRKSIAKYGMLIFDYRGTDFDNEDWKCYFRHHKRAEFKQCLDSWAERIDYHAVNTYEIGHDIAFMLDRLHFSKARFYGVSYGTYVGQMFARLHPERAEQLVLDGVVVFDKAWLQAEPPLSSLLEESYHYCGVNPNCAPYRGQKPDLAAIKKRFDANPLAVKKGEEKIGELDGDSALDVLVDNFRYNYIVGYDGLKKGAVSSSHYSEGAIESFKEMTFVFIICHIFAKDGADTSKLNPLQADLIKGIARDCQDVLPNSSYIPETPITPASRKVPVLLLSGSVDPATPHANAKKAQLDFDLTHDLVLYGGGHGVVADRCVMPAVEAFFENPQAKLPASCNFDDKDWFLQDGYRTSKHLSRASELGLKEDDMRYTNDKGSVFKAVGFSESGFDELKVRILVEREGGKFDAHLDHEVLSHQGKSLHYYRASLPDGKQLAAVVAPYRIYAWISQPNDESVFKQDITPLLVE